MIRKPTKTASKQIAQLLFWLGPIPVFSVLSLAADEVGAYVMMATIGATFSMPGFAVVLHFTPSISRVSSTRLYWISAILGVVCLGLSAIGLLLLDSIDWYAAFPFVLPVTATVLSGVTLSLACEHGFLVPGTTIPDF